MTTIFDQVVDRTQTNSLKWDRYRDQDILPMWVADMDFRSPPEIITALHERIEHGVFGYTHASDTLVQRVVDRLQNLYDWRIEPDWLVWLPGTVCGLNIAVRAVAAEGETVATPVPVYYPFLLAPPQAGRRMISVNWRQGDNGWYLDLDELESRITSDTRLFMLCNPQNPNGRVLTREELQAIEALCRRHDLVVCSDEIHCDLILDRQCEHIPYASLSDFSSERSITLMAPSKTFNIAGLACAFAVIPDPELRKQFNKAKAGIVPSADGMITGYIAAEAAYTYGEPWRLALLDYLRDNHDYLLQTINEMPGLSMQPLEATYLAWINVAELGLKDPKGFFEEHGVGLSPGAQFGDPDYLRLNFGCPRSQLEQALKRMHAAVTKHS